MRNLEKKDGRAPNNEKSISRAVGLCLWRELESFDCIDTVRLSTRRTDPRDGTAFPRLQGSDFPFGKNGEAPSLYKNVAIGDKLDLSSLLTEYSIPFCVGKLSQL